jgi:hypothetical protein
MSHLVALWWLCNIMHCILYSYLLKGAYPCGQSHINRQFWIQFVISEEKKNVHGFFFFEEKKNVYGWWWTTRVMGLCGLSARPPDLNTAPPAEPTMPTKQIIPWADYYCRGRRLCTRMFLNERMTKLNGPDPRAAVQVKMKKKRSELNNKCSCFISYPRKKCFSPQR